MLRLLPVLALAALAVAFPGGTPAQESPPAAPQITWKKTVLDRKFRSEGVAVADVNKDGKVDVLNGEYWYEAPDWTPHELQPFADHKDGLGNYSRVFACWADDLNGDGYPDLIVIDFPGAPCYWMENPGKALATSKGELHWKKHQLWHSACNETPLYTDLLGTGKRVLIMGYQPEGANTAGNEGRMAYFDPDPKDPNAKWVAHPLSDPEKGNAPGTNRFSHGLGVGDVNGDGKNDVICPNGWWEQPEKADGKTPWKFNPAPLGEACADMFAYDVDGDGKNDVISTSAHKFGIWFHRQGPPDAKTKQTPWGTTTLFGMLVSETHAAHFVDIDGDGVKDIVTGKRWWSHGRGEPGSSWSAPVYYLKGKKNADKVTSYFPVLIDDDCGVGTQFEVADVNGDKLLDVIVSNKKGVRVITQERK